MLANNSALSTEGFNSLISHLQSFSFPRTYPSFTLTKSSWVTEHKEKITWFCRLRVTWNSWFSTPQSPFQRHQHFKTLLCQVFKPLSHPFLSQFKHTQFKAIKLGFFFDCFFNLQFHSPGKLPVSTSLIPFSTSELEDQAKFLLFEANLPIYTLTLPLQFPSDLTLSVISFSKHFIYLLIFGLCAGSLLLPGFFFSSIK